jgi:hypothetical protein
VSNVSCSIRTEVVVVVVVAVVIVVSSCNKTSSQHIDLAKNRVRCIGFGEFCAGLNIHARMLHKSLCHRHLRDVTSSNSADFERRQDRVRHQTTSKNRKVLVYD